MAHRARFGGSWRTTKQPWVRHGGTWRQASAAWIRQGGAWVKWWPDLPDRGGPYLYGLISSAGPNVVRYDGSLWVSVGGGRSSRIVDMVVSDSGQLLAISNGDVFKWTGSAWSTVATFFGAANQRAATDGTRLFWTRDQNAAGPYAYIYQDGYGQVAQTEYYPSSGYSYFNTLGASQLGGSDIALYASGQWNTPYGAPTYFDPGGPAGTLSLFNSTFFKRQLDGLVWACWTAVHKETGLATFSQVGAGTFGGGIVRSVCALPDGRAFVGGDFTTYNGGACVALAEWNGTAWVQIGSGLTYVQSLAFHQGKLWILSGSSLTARKVYTWDGTTLALQSDWTGDSVYGLA